MSDERKREKLDLGDGSDQGKTKTEAEFLGSVGATGKSSGAGDFMKKSWYVPLLVLILAIAIPLAYRGIKQNANTPGPETGWGTETEQQQSHGVGFLDPGKKLVGVWTGSWNGWSKTDWCFNKDGTGSFNNSNGMMNANSSFAWSCDNKIIRIIVVEKNPMDLKAPPRKVDLGGEYEFQNEDHVLMIHHPDSSGGTTAYTRKGE